MHRAGNDLTNLSLDRTGSRSAPRFRLFCFPYAGGSSGIFRDWAAELELNVEVCAIRLPGRERRYSELPFRRAEQVVESLVPVLRPLLETPFVMFGHSMGAMLAFELTRGIRAATGVEPHALFVSAHRAPHLPLRRRAWHGLPHDELIAELKALNGTPPEVFEDHDLLELVLPILRSDLELTETYASSAGPRLSCPVIAVGGSDDPTVSPQELAEWRAVTAGPFKSIVFEGGHFFVNSARGSVLEVIRRELAVFGLV